MSKAGIELRHHMPRCIPDTWGLALILIVCLAVSLNAQEPQNRQASSSIPPAQLSASLDQAVAPVGGTVSLTLSYTLPQGSRLPDNCEIEGLQGIPITGIIKKPGCIILHFIVERLTDIILGPVSLAYLDANGTRQMIKADALILKVKSNLEKDPEKQQLRPIQDIIPLKSIWLPWVLRCSLAILAALMIIGLFIWYQHRVNPKDRQIPDLPPHIRARMDIEGLDTSGMFEKGEVKAFYFRFSHILKHYLEVLRGFPAAEYTIEEIASKVNTEVDQKIVVILKKADLVKFADDVPTKSSKDEDVMMALSYIAATAPGPGPAIDTGESRGNLL